MLMVTVAFCLLFINFTTEAPKDLQNEGTQTAGSIPVDVRRGPAGLELPYNMLAINMLITTAKHTQFFINKILCAFRLMQNTC
jgi:hypothetical protein